MTSFLKSLVRVALLLAPLGSWGLAQVACSTTYAGGFATPFTLYAINTATGAPLANSATTPRFNTLFANNGTNTTAATVAFARDPVTNRLYYIENTTTGTSRVGYFNFATGTTVAAGTITKSGGDTGAFTRFGFNSSGVGYASISANNAVYTITPATATSVTAARLGALTGLDVNLSGDFAMTSANRAWLSANGVVYRIRFDTLTATQVVNTGSTAANGVAFDSNGDLLVSSATEVSRVNLGTLSVSPVGTMTGQPNTSGDLANCIIPVLEPSLRAVKTVSPNGSVVPGSTLTYSIVVTNSGNVAATSTLFTDAIPANTTYVSGTTTLNGAAVADGTGGTMPFATGAAIKSPASQFTTGVLATGTANAATITFQVRVNNPFPTTATQISNQGTVTHNSGSDTTVSLQTDGDTVTAGTQATTTAVTGIDFGDAPDTATGTATGNYQTLASDGGPSHTITAGLRLGTAVTDADNGTLQSAAATADDLNATDDEDGVATFPYITTAAGQTVTVPVSLTNTTGAAATLVGFLDFNKDGDFADTGEASSPVTVAAGATSANVVFTTPAGLTAGTTYARFRISSTASEVTSPVGAASSGEVEDYQLTIGSPDLTLSKAHTPSSFVQGSTGNYRIRVLNNTVNATAPASGTITVVDTLPSGLSVPAGPVPLTVGGTVWSCSASGQVITCTRTGSIAVGSNSTFNFDVQVASPAPATVTNVASVSGGGEATVFDSNNSASDPTPTVDAGRLTLGKTVRNVSAGGSFGTSGAGEPGDELEYCISYSNPGQSPVTGAAVSDTIPAGTTAETAVADYAGAAIRWRIPGRSPQENLNLSAAVDTDEGELAAVLTVRLGTVPPAGAGEVCFRVVITDE